MMEEYLDPATDKEAGPPAPKGVLRKLPHLGRRRFVISALSAPTLVTLGAVAAETQLSAPAFAKKKKKASASKLASITHTRKKKWQ